MTRFLNVGCGQDVRASTDELEWVNLDYVKIDGVDVVHDLEETPWPFDDASFEGLLCNDVWEHVYNWRGFLAEVFRILKPGGQVKIRTCAWGVEQSFRDPDHKRWATRETFCYWTPGHWLFEKYWPYAGVEARFLEVIAEREGDNWLFVLQKL